MTDKDIIRLSRVEGFVRLNGIDEDGAHWTQFVVDTLALQEPGTCSICGREDLMKGWLRLDDGSLEVCEDHVIIVEMAP